MENEGLSARFPVEIFPEQIRLIITATNSCLKYPVDYIAASLLYAASVAIGNTNKVFVKNSFVESTAIYMAIVGRPGANKTHPLTFALKPIFKHDSKEYQKFIKEQKLYKLQLRQSAKKSKGDEAPPDLVEPKLIKLLVSDVTPEALATTHYNNPRGIGVYVDELAGWFKNFNRYNSGSETEFWLSAWSGSPINIERKTSDPLHILNPFITVAGTIQNGILKEMAKDDRSQNGFMDRVLFVIPDEVKKEYWSDDDLNQSIIDSWHNIANALINEPIKFNEDGEVKPNILRFTTEAKKLLFEWQRKNTDDCNDEGNDTVAGAFTKMDIYVPRFALILQLLNAACLSLEKSVIELNAVAGAIALVEYFKVTALKVQEILTDPLAGLSAKGRKVYEALPASFKTREGVPIAEENGMPERTFKRFLKKATCLRELIPVSTAKK